MLNWLRTLFARKYYRRVGECSNCEWIGVFKIQLGKPKTDGVCPNCRQTVKIK